MNITENEFMNYFKNAIKNPEAWAWFLVYGLGYIYAIYMIGGFILSLIDIIE